MTSSVVLERAIPEVGTLPPSPMRVDSNVSSVTEANQAGKVGSVTSSVTAKKTPQKGFSVTPEEKSLVDAIRKTIEDTTFSDDKTADGVMRERVGKGINDTFRRLYEDREKKKAANTNAAGNTKDTASPKKITEEQPPSVETFRKEAWENLTPAQKLGRVAWKSPFAAIAGALFIAEGATKVGKATAVAWMFDSMEWILEKNGGGKDGPLAFLVLALSVFKTAVDMGIDIAIVTLEFSTRFAASPIYGELLPDIFKTTDAIEKAEAKAKEDAAKAAKSAEETLSQREKEEEQRKKEEENLQTAYGENLVYFNTPDDPPVLGF